MFIELTLDIILRAFITLIHILVLIDLRVIVTIFTDVKTEVNNMPKVNKLVIGQPFQLGNLESKWNP